MEKRSRKKKKGKIKKPVIILFILAAAAAGIVIAMAAGRKSRPAMAEGEIQRTAVVTRQSITSELSSSGTLEAKDT